MTNQRGPYSEIREVRGRLVGRTRDQLPFGTVPGMIDCGVITGSPEGRENQGEGEELLL